MISTPRSFCRIHTYVCVSLHTYTYIGVCLWDVFSNDGSVLFFLMF